MPFLSSITAIDAKKRLAILDKVLVPAFPRKLEMGVEKLKIMTARKTFMSIAIAVGKIPYEFTRITDVVSTAGPVIRGTPIGTAPRASLSTDLKGLLPLVISVRAMVNKRIPPAIIKSDTLIPISLIKVGPINKKTSATPEAVIID